MVGVETQSLFAKTHEYVAMSVWHMYDSIMALFWQDVIKIALLLIFGLYIKLELSLW